MDGPSITEPPLAKFQTIFPVLASSAYICPEYEPAYMTPLATLTEPVSMVPTVGSAVCQRMFPGGNIKSAPCTPGYLLSRGHQGVRQMETIRDSDIDALTVGRRTPLDASERTARPNKGAPSDVAVIGIECPEDAALLAKADNITHEIGACPSKIKVLAGGNRTIRVCSCRPETRYCPGVKALQSLRPLDLSSLQIQRKGGVEEIIIRSAIRGRSRVLASFHTRGRGVVVSG